MSLTPCLPWRRLGVLRRLPSKCMEQVVLRWLEEDKGRDNGRTRRSQASLLLPPVQCRWITIRRLDCRRSADPPSALSFAFSANRYLTRLALLSDLLRNRRSSLRRIRSSTLATKMCSDPSVRARSFTNVSVRCIRAGAAGPWARGFAGRRTESRRRPAGSPP